MFNISQSAARQEGGEGESFNELTIKYIKCYSCLELHIHNKNFIHLHFYALYVFLSLSLFLSSSLRSFMNSTLQHIQNQRWLKIGNRQVFKFPSTIFTRSVI